MKKLYFTITLFIAFATQAQTLTEKDLLGSWKLSTSAMHGVLINFESGKATPQKGFEDTYSPAELKKIENGIKGEHPFPFWVKFLEGHKLEVVTGNGTDSNTYELIARDGKTYINDTIEEYEVRVAADVLSFVYVTDDDEIIISFKKI